MTCVKGARSKLRRRSVTESSRLRDAMPSSSNSCSRFITKNLSITTCAVSICILWAKICQVFEPRVMCDGRMRRSTMRPLGPCSSTTSARTPTSPDTLRSVSLNPAESCTRPCLAPPVSESPGRWSIPA